MWDALTPDQQIHELRSMHLKLETMKDQMSKDLAQKDKEVEELSSSDSVLVRKEIVEQNQKLQLDVHNLVKDLKNRCQKVIELELALDKERDVRTMLEKRSNKGGGRGSVSSSQYQAQQKQMRALQKRLEQLVMVHRQLLRKYAQVSDFFDDSILPRS